jgi:hypothetical protein
MTEAAYNAWRADRDAGLVSVLIAETHEDVTALNGRARADLILNKTLNPDREVELRDGTAAGVGDTIITRQNNRNLRTLAGRDWVRNGDIWTITAVGDDGTITIARDYGTGATVRDDGTIRARRRGRRFGGSIVLPASYVAEHVDLGYAVTAYRAQGVTTDTAHVLVEPTSTRETFYVAMTRGRHSNHAYVALDRADDHAQPHPGDDRMRPREACSTAFCSTAEPNSRRTRPSWPNRNSGAPSLNSPPSTRPSPPQLNTTAGPPSSGAPGSPTNRPRAPSSPRRSARSPPNSAALKPTITMSMRCCRALSPRAGSATPTTSPPSSTTGSNGRPPVPQARAGPASQPRLIAGLIPQAHGVIDAEMRAALDEREVLIEARADAVLDGALTESVPWTKALGAQPNDRRRAATWRKSARVVAAYRDRYRITDDTPLGAPPESAAQKIDAARARAATYRAQAASRGADAASTTRARHPNVAAPTL